MVSPAIFVTLQFHSFKGNHVILIFLYTDLLPVLRTWLRIMGQLLSEGTGYTSSHVSTK